jgi:signal transduction histidine kinase
MNLFRKFCIGASLFAILLACSGKQTGSNVADTKQEKPVMDSIAVLEKLVTSNKATDNFRSRLYAQQAYSFALHTKSQEALVKSLVLLGISNTNFNNDSSFRFYSMALRLAHKHRIEWMKPSIYYNLASISLSVMDSRMYLIYLDSTLNVATRIGNQLWRSNAYNALGNARLDILDSINARIFLDSAFRIAKRNALPLQMGIALGGLAKFETTPAATVKKLHDAIRMMHQQQGTEEEIALTLINIGTFCVNPDSAIRYFQEAINIGRACNSPEVIIAAYNNLAYSYIDKHDVDGAEECLTKYAIPVATKTENLSWLSTLYDTYTDVLLAANKHAQAVSRERTALKMRLKADQKQANEQVRLLSSMLDLKNKELMIRAKEKEVDEQASRIQVMSIGFSISLLVFILALLFVGWILQRNKIRYQKEMLSSAKRLLEMEENMKGRISMELHDLTTPFYTNMLHQIEKAQIKDSSIVEELKNKVTAMAENIRQISHRMNSNFIEQLTLGEMVRGLCLDLKEISNVTIHCEIEKDRFRLSHEENLHVYRIIQELLTNGIKYVKFGELNISLTEEAGMLFILYQDNGIGFDPDALKSQGLGINNIHERAKIINGRAVLNTFPGKGTKWNICVPLKPSRKSKHEKVLA